MTNIYFFLAGFRFAPGVASATALFIRASDLINGRIPASTMIYPHGAYQLPRWPRGVEALTPERPRYEPLNAPYVNQLILVLHCYSDGKARGGGKC